MPQNNYTGRTELQKLVTITLEMFVVNQFIGLNNRFVLPYLQQVYGGHFYSLPGLEKLPALSSETNFLWA